MAFLEREDFLLLLLSVMVSVAGRGGGLYGREEKWDLFWERGGERMGFIGGRTGGEVGVRDGVAWWEGGTRRIIVEVLLLLW